MIEININLYIVLLLVFYVMSVYRMAYMITDDTGPLEIFERFRLYSDRKLLESATEQHYGKFVPYWKWRILFNFNEGINCVYCTGVWSATILVIPLYLALFYPMWSLPLVILGGAGGQHYLTNK